MHHFSSPLCFSIDKNTNLCGTNRFSKEKEWKVDLSFVVLRFFNTFVVFRTCGVA
jgi:hypothetical protein